jgi:hypothetical protein
VEYVGHVIFAPSSIRLYSPPLAAKYLQQLMDNSGIKKDGSIPEKWSHLVLSG